MDYGEEGSYEQLFSSLTPEMTQDTWLGGIAETTVVQSAPEENGCYGDIASGNGLQYLSNGTTDGSQQDIFLATDDDIDRVVQQMFERSATKEGPRETVNIEEMPARTPSPPEDLVYAEIHGPMQPPMTNDYNQNFRVPSPPIDSNYTYIQQQPLPSIQAFSSSTMGPGGHVGYVATTFAPSPVSLNSDLPLPFGFYTSMAMPQESVVNASSFTGSLSANAGGLFSRNSRNTTFTTMAKTNVVSTSTTVESYAAGTLPPTPLATSTPKPVSGRSSSFSVSSATKPFYQPTITKMKEIRPAKGSIEERSPMITALLKSQSQIFGNPKSVPKPLILAIKKPKQTKRKDPRSKQKESPVPSRSASAGETPLLIDPAIITLDGNSDVEDLTEEAPPVLDRMPHNDNNNNYNSVKNPAVIVFPNMRNFSILGDCQRDRSRPTLCAQTRTVIGRVLAYNMEVRKRMGNGYVGPWLSPIKLTSYMTGVSTTLVKQCEEFATKKLTTCIVERLERKKVVKNSETGPVTPQNNRHVDPEPVKTVLAPPKRDPPPLPPKRDHPPVISKIPRLVAPMPVETPEDGFVPIQSFDWASLYNGAAPGEGSRKRSHTVCGIWTEDYPSDEKRPRFGEEKAWYEDAAVMRILNSLPKDYTDEGQRKNEVRGVLDDLVDAVCREENGSKAVMEQTQRYAPFPAVIRNNREGEGWPKVLVTPAENMGITRFSASAASPFKAETGRGRYKPFVPTIADEPFRYHGKNPRSLAATNYNFRPRENIAKKRFTY